MATVLALVPAVPATAAAGGGAAVTGCRGPPAGAASHRWRCPRGVPARGARGGGPGARRRRPRHRPVGHRGAARPVGGPARPHRRRGSRGRGPAGPPDRRRRRPLRQRLHRALDPPCGEQVCVHYVPTTADAPPSADWVNLDPGHDGERLRPRGRPARLPRPARRRRHGGDARLDVYLKDLGAGLYGYCAAEYARRRRTASGFCVLDNDYAPAQFPAEHRPRTTSRSPRRTSSSTPCSTPTTTPRTPGCSSRRPPGWRSGSPTTSTTTASTSATASCRRRTSRSTPSARPTASSTATGSSGSTSPSSTPRASSRRPGGRGSLPQGRPALLRRGRAVRAAQEGRLRRGVRRLRGRQHDARPRLRGGRGVRRRDPGRRGHPQPGRRGPGRRPSGSTTSRRDAVRLVPGGRPQRQEVASPGPRRRPAPERLPRGDRRRAPARRHRDDGARQARPTGQRRRDRALQRGHRGRRDGVGRQRLDPLPLRSQDVAGLRRASPGTTDASSPSTPRRSRSRSVGAEPRSQGPGRRARPAPARSAPPGPRGCAAARPAGRRSS